MSDKLADLVGSDQAHILEQFHPEDVVLLASWSGLSVKAVQERVRKQSRPFKLRLIDTGCATSGLTETTVKQPAIMNLIDAAHKVVVAAPPQTSARDIKRFLKAK